MAEIGSNVYICIHQLTFEKNTKIEALQNRYDNNLQELNKAHKNEIKSIRETYNSDIKELVYETQSEIDYEPYTNAINNVDPTTGIETTILGASDIFKFNFPSKQGRGKY